ncbi:hypothetical protein VNI00_014034 [Paramarasmius palmivorus]|uniref:C2H2-type domain-containing protein n=1 Tax=Paramarasmius palmivorus TaxID=297713 RepID=A0AAW0BYQ9_9AGAR
MAEKSVLGHRESNTHVPEVTETRTRQEHDEAVAESWLELFSSCGVAIEPHDPSDAHEVLRRLFSPITDQPTSQSPPDIPGGVENSRRSLGLERQNVLATTNSASGLQPIATRSRIPSLSQGNVLEEASPKPDGPLPKADHTPKHHSNFAGSCANLPSYVSSPADGEPRKTAANATDPEASDEYWASLFEFDIPTQHRHPLNAPLAQDGFNGQWDPNLSPLGSSYPPMPLSASATPMPSQPPTPTTEGSLALSSVSHAAYYYNAKDTSHYATPPYSRVSTPFVSHPVPTGPLNQQTQSAKRTVSIPISEPRPGLPATTNVHPIAHLPTPRSSITPSPRLTSGYPPGPILPPPQLATSREGTPRLAQISCSPNPSAPVPITNSTRSHRVETPPPSARIIASIGKKVQVSQPVAGPYSKRNQLPRQQRPLPRLRSPGPMMHPQGENPKSTAPSMDQGSHVPLERGKAPETGNNVRKRKARVDASVTSRSSKRHVASAETSKGHAEAPVASSSRMELSTVGSASTSETTRKQSLRPDGSEKTYPPPKSRPSVAHPISHQLIHDRFLFRGQYNARSRDFTAGTQEDSYETCFYYLRVGVTTLGDPYSSVRLVTTSPQRAAPHQKETIASSKKIPTGARCKFWLPLHKPAMELSDDYHQLSTAFAGIRDSSAALAQATSHENLILISCQVKTQVPDATFERRCPGSYTIFHWLNVEGLATIKNSESDAAQRPLAFGTESVFDGISGGATWELSVNGANINGLESGFETGHDTTMSSIQDCWRLLTPPFCSSTTPSFGPALLPAPAPTGLTPEPLFLASDCTSSTLNGHNSYVPNLAPTLFAPNGPSNVLPPSMIHSHDPPTASLDWDSQALVQRSMAITPYQREPHAAMAHEPLISMQPFTLTHCTPPLLPIHRQVKSQPPSQQIAFPSHFDNAVRVQTEVAPANSLPYPTPLGPWLPQTQVLESSGVFTFSVRFGPIPNGQQHLFHTGLPAIPGQKRRLEEECASQLHSLSQASVGFRCRWTGKRSTHCTRIFANEFQLANHVYDTHYDESRNAKTRLFSCLWHSGCDNNSTDLHGRPKEPGFADWSNLKRHIMEVHCGITRSMKYGPRKRQKL